MDALFGWQSSEIVEESFFFPSCWYQHVCLRRKSKPQCGFKNPVALPCWIRRSIFCVFWPSWLCWDSSGFTCQVVGTNRLMGTSRKRDWLREAATSQLIYLQWTTPIGWWVCLQPVPHANACWRTAELLFKFVFVFFNWDWIEGFSLRCNGVVLRSPRHTVWTRTRLRSLLESRTISQRPGALRIPPPPPPPSALPLSCCSTTEVRAAMDRDYV